MKSENPSHDVSRHESADCHSRIKGLCITNICLLNTLNYSVRPDLRGRLGTDLVLSLQKL
jgi:hypothetical protein